MAGKKAKKPIKLYIIFGGFCLIFLGLIGRMVYLEVVKGDFLKTKANLQWTNDTIIRPRRGDILDRNYQQLAVEGQVYRVDLDNKTLKQTLKDKKISDKSISSSVADILGMKADDVYKDINKTMANGLPSLSVVLKRGINKQAADKLKALNIRGIIVSSDSKRYYRNDNLLSQVIGHTNSDGDGTAGVEESYNSVLKGIPGKKITEVDNTRSPLPYEDSTYTPPVDGKDVITTIDENIQDIADRAAQKALTDNKAKAVTITVMNPKNGEILAMASKPDYNPNSPYAGTTNSNQLLQSWQNRAVQSAFEPGSIFKAITAETALEEGTEAADSQFECDGSLKVATATINCWERSGHGKENFIDILRNSCNVGFMEVGQKLGKDRLYKHINIDKFGQKTGIDLPGESAGSVIPINKVGPVELSTISFGQGILVTSVQYMAAFNAIANGGTWIRPHIMKEIGHYDNNNQIVVDSKYNDYGKTTIMDSNITTTLRGYLRQVVSNGVGSNAEVPGLDIAGKTGTAQKADPKTGGYAPGKYMASFAGMAPYKDPKITLLISIDEPDPAKYYAGQVAAPVAGGLFKDIMSYLNTNDVLDN